MSSAETIYSLSSAAGRAGVAVIRVSGPHAGDAIGMLAGLNEVPPRTAVRVRLTDPHDRSPLDDGLALWFPAPRSFTGENVVELHVHGGRAVVAGVLSAIGRLTGFRLAEPGEFTRRAFENDKLDLTEAEALADLIDAETEAQRRQALNQLAGNLHRQAEAWRAALVEAQALVEAAIDFADEGDVSAQAVGDAVRIVADLERQMRVALDRSRAGEIVRDGFKVAIAGPPNVGKSSLINALSGREAAIVSAEAGTTRDVVELQLNLGGLAVVLADTAGIRDAAGTVEREGIRRAIERVRNADLVLWVVDATAPDRTIPAELACRAGQTLWVINKADRVGMARAADVGEAIGAGRSVAVSAISGTGLASLEAAILARARASSIGGEAALITSARHRQKVEAAAASLAAFGCGSKSDLELRAEDIRRAAEEIGRLVGRVGPEEVLGEIFGRFCIGK